MKRFIACIASLTLALHAHAGDWTDDYEAALARAKAESRFVLLDFTGSDWCGWCIRLDKEVFSQSEFKKYADENLVCVTVDFPRKGNLPGKVQKQNEALKSEFGIRGYPTIILLNPDGKQVAQTGYKEGGAEAYVAHIEELIGKQRERYAAKAAKAALQTDPGGFRTWTSQKGSTIEARVEQRVGNKVFLRTRDNKQIAIDITSLSESDQTFLRSGPSTARP